VCGHHCIADGQTNGRKRLQHFNATDTHGAAGLQEELGERPVDWGDHDDLAKLAEIALDQVQKNLVGAGDGKVLSTNNDVTEHDAQSHEII